MFEVVEPQLEGDEVFDSSLLKQMIESMIAAGKRNICVDLAGQDYLYSDAINALIGMNKRMLDVMGRLSLVAPQPTVLEILKKGGIANILKIFVNDDDLLQVSQQLMGGAPPVASIPAAPPVPQEPQSEFDELRSEIGSAFGNIAPPQQQREAAPPQSPFADASFPTYKTQQQPRQAFPPPPAGPAPRYAPPPPPLRPIDPALQKPVPRPVVPPPPMRPPSVPLTSGAETRRMPSIPEVPVPPAPPAGKSQPQFEPATAPEAEADLSQFEATLEKKPQQPVVQKRDRFDEDIEVKKKRSFAPVLVTLILLIGLGAGGYYAYTSGLLNKSAPTPAVTPAPETVIPQVPVPAPEPAVTTPTDSTPVATPAVEQTPEKKPATTATTPSIDAKAAAAKEAAAKAAAEKAAAARVAAKAAAEKAVAAREAAAKSAAEKTAARAAAAKVAAEKTAAVREAAARAAAEKAATAKEAAAKVAAAREAAMKEAAARGAAAREAAAAKAVEPAPAPKSSTVEVLDEPAAPTPPKPVVSAPTPEPEPATAESATSETGTIFISSNPPLADVYLDGKLIGKTSIKELTVPTGTHTIRLVKGEKEMTKQMTFLAGKNPSVFMPIK